MTARKVGWIDRAGEEEVGRPTAHRREPWKVSLRHWPFEQRLLLIGGLGVPQVGGLAPAAKRLPVDAVYSRGCAHAERASIPDRLSFEGLRVHGGYVSPPIRFSSVGVVRRVTSAAEVSTSREEPCKRSTS